METAPAVKTACCVWGTSGRSAATASVGAGVLFVTGVGFKGQSALFWCRKTLQSAQSLLLMKHYWWKVFDQTSEKKDPDAGSSHWIQHSLFSFLFFYH